MTAPASAPGRDAHGEHPAYLPPVRVCAIGDLPEVGTVAADIDGRIICLARTAEGGIHAIDDECTHGNVSLSEGELEGCAVECWLHGSRFDLVTGAPSCPPATVPVAVHHVTIDGDDVLVALKNDTTGRL